jgi:hypothetical protein
MEIFVDVTVKGKEITPGNVIMRTVVLMKDESRNLVKDQILDTLRKDGEKYVDLHIPGKFGRGEKYIFSFAYSILDRYDAETKTWSGAQATINLMGIQPIDKQVIQVANSLS